MVKYAWDEAKNKTNLAKHGVAFEQPLWCSTIRFALRSSTE